jgi:hypothetical protein
VADLKLQTADRNCGWGILDVLLQAKFTSKVMDMQLLKFFLHVA